MFSQPEPRLSGKTRLVVVVIPDIDQDHNGLVRKLEIFSAGSALGHNHTPAEPCSCCLVLFWRPDFLYHYYCESCNDNGGSAD